MKLSRERIIQHFGDLWPAHNRGFTSLLVESRKLCESDLDQVLILSAIGTRTLLNRRTEGLSYDEFLEGRRTTRVTKKINLQSIADGTGIPRETARRKINRLVARGWLKKNNDGSLEVSDRAVRELAPATQATFDYLVDLGNAVLGIVTETGNETADKRVAEQSNK